MCIDRCPVKRHRYANPFMHYQKRHSHCQIYLRHCQSRNHRLFHRNWIGTLFPINHQASVSIHCLRKSPIRPDRVRLNAVESQIYVILSRNDSQFLRPIGVHHSLYRKPKRCPLIIASKSAWIHSIRFRIKAMTVRMPNYKRLIIIFSRHPMRCNRSNEASWRLASVQVVQDHRDAKAMLMSMWRQPRMISPATRPKYVNTRNASTRRFCALLCGAWICWSERRTDSCYWIDPVRARWI